MMTTRSPVSSHSVPSQELKISLTELNPHFVCVLCFGYFVDATTITECMHTFCKSCIVNFLRTNHHCPYCDTLLSRTRPFNSLRPDHVMQSLVYKTVPGLFQTEMRRRIQFYQSHPHPDFEADVEHIQNYIFSPEDSVSLSIKYHRAGAVNEESRSNCGMSEQQQPIKEEEDDDSDRCNLTTVRYFRCPATVPVSVLKALVKTKYRIPDFCRVELLYGDERLINAWTLMEIAYIFQWDRDSPMELDFQVFVTRKVKRKKLRLVRKVKSDHQNEFYPLGDTSRRVGDDDSTKEPPLKIPRIEEPQSTYSLCDEHHHRPPTPPETPDVPTDVTLYADRQKSPSRSPSGRCEITDSCSLKIIFKPQEQDDSTLPVQGNKIAAISAVEESESRDEDICSQEECDERDTYQKSSSEEEIDSKLCGEAERSDQENSAIDNDVDNCPLDDGDSGDCAGDQDSEAALEVDTSHETEPENDGDVDLGKGDMDSFHEGSKNEDEMYEEEQGDSAIDVNETSASEVMDSDDKDTDFNLSAESIDIDSNCRKTSEKKLEIESDTQAIKPEEEDSTEHDTKAKCKDDLSDVEDVSGVLDLSCHARTVRALRESSQSPESVSSSPSRESEKDAKVQDLQEPLVTTQTDATKQSAKDSSQQGQHGPLLKSNLFSVAGTGLLPTASVVARPPLPLEWTRPSLIGSSIAPHAAAFNLMTLSHAAVQLQLAMAQAQAHAQAQAQVQAQKMQAQVQASVLKNLKATETLSFVNGSGDTLTISPIPGSQGNTKSKLFTKPKAMKGSAASQNNVNVNRNAPHSKPKISNSLLSNRPNKNIPVHNGETASTKIEASTTNNPMRSISHSSTNSNTSNSTSSSNNNNNSNFNNNNTFNNNNNHSKSSCNINKKTFHSQSSIGNSKSSQYGSLKTVIPRSALTSLKIPNIPLSSKGDAAKTEREKKQEDKDNERTGDPVFKITNQKLIEFVRQQHLHKLKQNNKQTSSSEGLTLKITNNTSTVVSNISTKSTVSTVPTSISNTLSNKTSASTVPVKTGSDNMHSNNKSAVNSSSKPSLSPVTKSSQSSSKIFTGTTKPQPSLIKSQTSVSKSPSSVIKPQSTDIKPQSSASKPQTPVCKPQTPVSKPQSVMTTKAPVMMTKAPVMMTKAPVMMTKAPVMMTKAPVSANKSPAVPLKSPMISLNKIPSDILGSSTRITIDSVLSSSCASSSTGSSSLTVVNGNSEPKNSGEQVQPQPKPNPNIMTTIPKPLIFSSPSAVSSATTIRTTNTHVRQIPNPSRLHQQSESRLSAGMARLSSVSKKGVTTSKSEGMSRIESLTRSLHEKVAASAGVAAGVINSLAR